ncbi:ABC-type Fe3+/spermidine/putrescine transport system ATPase subunit [Marisediminicola sp. UYEF4]|uniref:ABC transporter ATP-binding protein n=1 Tax=Marisediminicola sp. UYEF4 TaxID=1756384 RepID=UPI0033963F0C
MSRLSMRNVVVGYGVDPVLRGISLEVPNGSLVAIVGPSGCGKTTLLRTIAGLIRARSGEVRLGPRMVTTHGIHLAPEKRRIGWVPQDAALFPHLTVAENIAFGLGGGRRAARRAAGEERVRHLLALVGLSELADRSPAQLSGGQAQRVALARALASGPEVVLMDEPFGALDPLLRGELRTEVRALLGAEGMTGILVTHDQAEALSIADYVAVMSDGEILQFGTPAEVYERPANPWVATFVGDSVFLPGFWRSGSVVGALGSLDAEWMPRVAADGQSIADSSGADIADGALAYDDNGVRRGPPLRSEIRRSGETAPVTVIPGGSRTVAEVEQAVEQAVKQAVETMGGGETSGEGAADLLTRAGASDGIARAGASDEPVENTPVTVLVRPEQLELTQVVDSVPARGLRATVTAVSYTGHDALLELSLLSGTRCMARVAASGLLPVGAEVTIEVRGRVLAYPAAQD